MDDAAVIGIQEAWFRLVHHARIPVVRRQIMSNAHVQIDRGVYTVLSRIAEWGPIRLTQLADQMMIDLSTTSRHVARLEEERLVRRSPDPADGRAILLSATPEGRAAVRRVTEAWRAAFGSVLADWKRRDVVALADLLGRLADDLLRLRDMTPNERAAGLGG